MTNLFSLRHNFPSSRQLGKSTAEKWLYLGRGIGLAVLALLRFSLVLLLCLSGEWRMIWFFYIFILLDLPVKILYPPTPLLWLKHLVRIFLSKRRLWRFFMGLLFWDLTLLLLLVGLVVAITFAPGSWEMLPFLLLGIVFSLLDSMLAFVLLVFSKKGSWETVMSVVIFALALGAISLMARNTMVYVLFACLLAQVALFGFLVKRKLYLM